MPGLAESLAGLSWFAVGSAKLASPEAIGEYLGTRLELFSGGGMLVAYLVAAVEVGLGLGLLMLRSLSAPAARVVSAVAVAGASGVLLYLLVRGRESVDCGCFGGLVRATHGRRLMVAGALLLLSASCLYPRSRPAEESARG